MPEGCVITWQNKQSMKRISGFLMVFALIAGVGMWIACEKDGNENEDGASHNVGNDCLACHRAGGVGEGVFTAGGTVYKAGTVTGAAGATVSLFDNAGGAGTPVATMTSSGTGNFYTKSAISFGTGLYVKITSPVGSGSMSSPITSGACNSCHGVSTGKITVQ